MDTNNPHAASPAIAAALLERADANGLMSFADFSEVALFAPQIGYYTGSRKRVGLSPESDFYTASSVGPVFGKLVLQAAATLSGYTAADNATLVEIGAERGNGVFEALPGSNPEQPESARTATDADASPNGSTAFAPAPFSRLQTLPIGAPWQWDSPAVIFANELLDAQPFHRLQWLGGQWREWGVRCDERGLLSEALLPKLSEPVQRSLAAELPSDLPDGYRLDISLAAETLLTDLLSRNWLGTFILFDYGMLWQELISARPAGTARAYRHHRLSADLLAHAGQQDLTCHVCWDRLERIAVEHGFAKPRLERQEAFFMHYSMAAIEKIISAAPESFDPDRQALMSLLHPSHLGSKFQALHASRTAG